MMDLDSFKKLNYPKFPNINETIIKSEEHNPIKPKPLCKKSRARKCGNIHTTTQERENVETSIHFMRKK
jgi:hypothetical protein